jgi:hypothetical protein
MQNKGTCTRVSHCNLWPYSWCGMIWRANQMYLWLECEHHTILHEFHVTLRLCPMTSWREVVHLRWSGVYTRVTIGSLCEYIWPLDNGYFWLTGQFIPLSMHSFGCSSCWRPEASIYTWEELQTIKVVKWSSKGISTCMRERESNGMSLVW